MTRSALYGRNEAETIEMARIMVVTCGENYDEARRRMKAEHGVKVHRTTLKKWCDADPIRFQEIRRELAPKIETELTHDMLENARKITIAERIAIEKAQVKLENDEDNDPARVGRDLSQMRSQGLEKRALMEGKPTQITASRSPDEIVRALEALGVAKKVDAIAEASEVKEDD